MGRDAFLQGSFPRAGNTFCTDFLSTLFQDHPAYAGTTDNRSHKISILTSATGQKQSLSSTLQHKKTGYGRILFQSTHPSRGATKVAVFGVDSGRISIHAPLAGCDRQNPRLKW